MGNEYLDKLHGEILDIMDTIHEICEKNNLKYYLIGGTLLGAVRHKGFIPWDDDFDIVMPRPDFDKFQEICKTQLPENLEYLWYTTESKYWLPFAKVANVNTLFAEESNVNAGRLYGIFIDIFPLDVTCGYSGTVQLRSSIVRKIKVALFSRSGARRTEGFKKIIINLLPISAYQQLLLFFMRSNKQGDFYSNYGSQYSIKKQTMPIEWYGEGVSLQFENRLYCGPSKYDNVLRSIYGDKFMELPPEEKRRTHYPQNVKFSDGTEMHFNNQSARVSVEESTIF